MIDQLDHHMQEVARGASIAFALKLAGAALTFGFNVALARLLGAEDAGIYFLALTLTTIATVFGRIGLDNALLRFTAASSAVGDWVAVKGVYRTGLRLALAASTASAVVLYLLAPWLASFAFSKPELAAPLRWMAIAVVPVVVFSLHGELLKALKRIFESLTVLGFTLPAASLIVLLVAAPAFGVTGAVWAYTAGAMVAAVLGIGLWRRATPQLRGLQGRFSTEELLDSSLPLLWVKSMNMAIGWMATIILGIWGTAAEVGIFNAASRTVLLGGLVLMAVNSIAAPKFAALYRSGDLSALNSMARNTTKMMIGIASPLLLLLVFAPRLVMGLFGPEFLAGSALLVVLALGQFVNVATGSVGYLLMMTGHEKLMRNSVAIAAALNLALNFTLVPVAGAMGAAIATAISLATLNLVATYYVWLRLGIVMIPLIRSRTNE